MEILAILVVALIVLGPKRLPEAGRQIGRFMAEVRRWSHTMQNEIRDVIESEPATAPSPTTTTTSVTTTAAETASTTGSADPAPGRALTD